MRPKSFNLEKHSKLRTILEMQNDWKIYITKTLNIQAIFHHQIFLNTAESEDEQIFTDSFIYISLAGFSRKHQYTALNSETAY